MLPVSSIEKFPVEKNFCFIFLDIREVTRRSEFSG